MEFEAIKVLTLDNINEKVVCASRSKAGLHRSVVENKKQIHHNMCLPATETEPEKKFNIDLPPMLCSSVNEMTSKDGTKSHHFFGILFTEYYKMQRRVNTKIDGMLREIGTTAPAEELKKHLLGALKAYYQRAPHNHPAEKAQELATKTCEEELGRTKPMTTDFYRHIALKVFIQDEMEKDVEAMILMKQLINLQEVYCNSLDAAPDIKETIFNEIGIENAALDEPTRKKMADIIVYSRHTTGPLNGKIDYTRSPQLAMKWMESVPDEDKKSADQIIMSEVNGAVLWTKVFDFATFPMRNTKLNTREEVDRPIYRKGDSKSGVKPAFNMECQVVTAAPSIFWGALQKIGVMQLKASKHSITKYIEMRSGNQAMPDDEYQRIMARTREFRSRYNPDDDDEPAETGNFVNTNSSSSTNSNLLTDSKEDDEETLKRKTNAIIDDMLIGQDDVDPTPTKRAKFGQ